MNEPQELPDYATPAEPEHSPELATLMEGVVTQTERRVEEDAFLFVHRHLDAYQRMAEGVARSGMTHHTRSADVLTIIVHAKELGLEPMTALRGMYVVNGKLAVETWLMEQLAARLGVTKTVVEEGPMGAEIVFHRPGREDVRTSFTLDDAQRAELIQEYTVDEDGNLMGLVPAPRKRVWALYPDRMCWWRCVSKGLRMIAPDVFGGMYVPEEAGSVERDGTGVGRASELNAALGLGGDE